MTQGAADFERVTSLAFKWPNFTDDEKTFKTHSEHVYQFLLLAFFQNEDFITNTFCH